MILKSKPRIAVTALNPHAGDGGLIGDDEMVKILPAINYCKKKISLKGLCLLIQHL